MSAALEQLLTEGRLWRGQSLRRTEATPSGYPVLDAVLPGGGWPLGALSEVVHAAPGSGELRLLLPLLARLSQAGQSVALIGPPLPPYAPGWAQRGVQLPRLVVVDAPDAQQVDCAVQLLQAGAGAVCCWPRRMDETDARRLSLAAEAARSHALWMRTAQARGAPSTAALRLRVQAGKHALQVDVLKVRGGAPVMNLSLPWTDQAALQSS